nr:MAG TPA: hypothetical protein [Caudoviricetes sp.]
MLSPSVRFRINTGLWNIEFSTGLSHYVRLATLVSIIDY